MAAIYVSVYILYRYNYTLLLKLKFEDDIRVYNLIQLFYIINTILMKVAIFCSDISIFFYEIKLFLYAISQEKFNSCTYRICRISDNFLIVYFLRCFLYLSQLTKTARYLKHILKILAICYFQEYFLFGLQLVPNVFIESLTSWNT